MSFISPETEKGSKVTLDFAQKQYCFAKCALTQVSKLEPNIDSGIEEMVDLFWGRSSILRSLYGEGGGLDK